jgi:hypothetical protein
MIKSSADLLCCSSLIGLILFTALLARGIQLLLHAWSLRGFKKGIDVDGARCLLSENGEIIIRRTVFKSVASLIFIVGFFSLMIYGLLAVLFKSHDAFSTLIQGIGTLVFAAVLILSAQKIILHTMMLPGIRIIPGERTMVIAGRSENARIPFSNIRQIQFATSPAGVRNVWVSHIHIAYFDGSTRELGSISGDRKSVDRRIQELGRMLSDAIGVPFSSAG